MSAGTLEELIDENHVIVSPSVGPEYDVSIFSFVYKDQLEPGCATLMHNKIFIWNTDAWGYGPETTSLYQSHPSVLALLPDGRASGVLADTARCCEIDLREGSTAKFTADAVHPVITFGPFESPTEIAGTFRERRYLVTSYGCILTTWMGFGVLRLTKYATSCQSFLYEVTMEDVGKSLHVDCSAYGAMWDFWHTT